MTTSVITKEKLVEAIEALPAESLPVLNEFVALLQSQFRSQEMATEDEQMEQEIAAFHRLHPQLVKQYLGQYVAVFNGDVVDNGSDLGQLTKRISAKYPDVVVLVRRVEEQPERVIHVRSPRLSRVV